MTFMLSGLIKTTLRPLELSLRKPIFFRMIKTINHLENVSRKKCSHIFDSL